MNGIGLGSAVKLIGGKAVGVVRSLRVQALEGGNRVILVTVEWSRGTRSTHSVQSLLSIG